MNWLTMVLHIAVGNMRIKAQRGFTYLTVLLLVFILLLGLSAASEQVATVAQREREAELIFAGEQYRNAIASYYQNSPGGLKQLPLSLESLVLDKRSINPIRHIRRLYQDPITRSNEWGVVKTPQGEISGVYSLSNEPVLTTINSTNLSLSSYTDENSSQLKMVSYSEWKFVYKPDNKDNSPVKLNESDVQSELVNME